MAAPGGHRAEAKVNTENGRIGLTAPWRRMRPVASDTGAS